MSDKYVKLDDLMKFPIRRDHCDKENADPGFIHGIETVFEFIDNLPVYQMTAVTNKRNQLSFEERTYCLNWIQEKLCEMSHRLQHYKERFVNFDTYAASELKYAILENISDILATPGHNRQFAIESSMAGMKSQINMFFFKNLMRKGDSVVITTPLKQTLTGTIVSLDEKSLKLHCPAIGGTAELDGDDVVSFEITKEASS